MNWWEAAVEQAEIALCLCEGDDWRDGHKPAFAAIRLSYMRALLSAAVGLVIDRLRVEGDALRAKMEDEHG
mgnify:CR=1 FL=1